MPARMTTYLGLQWHSRYHTSYHYQNLLQRNTVTLDISPHTIPIHQNTASPLGSNIVSSVSARIRCFLIDFHFRPHSLRLTQLLSHCYSHTRAAIFAPIGRTHSHIPRLSLVEYDLSGHYRTVYSGAISFRSFDERRSRCILDAIPMSAIMDAELFVSK